MPELPEVETTRRGITRHILGQTVVHIIVRNPRLRQPISPRLGVQLAGQRVEAVERRGKYLLLRMTGGTLILHLGMSGSLRLVSPDQPPGPHDHVDWVFENGVCLRLRDPRRFGVVIWTQADPARHALLRHLGPEPLETLEPDYLFEHARGRRSPVKAYIMDGRVLVGIGNIYANEALFRAGIHPARAAGRISRARYQRLTGAIREVLREAIRQGGTTLRDFVDGEGRPGYFRVHLQVYGRTDEPCVRCGKAIRLLPSGQRSTYYCPVCQR